MDAGAGARGAFPVRAVGDRACIVDLPDLDAVMRVASALRNARIPGVAEVVPAARTVLAVCEDRAAVRRVEAAVGDRELGEAAGVRSREVPIDVVYDGADLAEVAELVGLSAEAVVSAHSGTPWRAAFCGFAPGFAYLVGGDPRLLEVPRLASPRTVVPAGSVALAGGFSAVYPGESPGGWRLLGRTGARLWDPSRAQPALVAPGDTVRFRPVRERVEARGRRRGTAPGGAGPGEPAGTAAFTVVAPGMQTTVQDAGRPGNASLGVTASGAADRGALARANRAVGNAEGAAALEALGGGLVLRADRALTVAVSGADAPILVETPRGRRDEAPDRAFGLHPGERLRLGMPERGLRCYVAVRGGIAGRPELGSLAHDSLSGLGIPPLSAGDRLAAGPDSAPRPPAAPGERPPRLPAPDEPAVLRFVPGPRDDWFAAGEPDRLARTEWRVSPVSNRVGLRLETGAEPLRRSRAGELAPEGTVRGALQVPPSGLPVLLLADHPVTGGYPVIGAVIDADLDLAGQLRPGQVVRFQAVDPDDPEPGRAARADGRVSCSIEVDGRRFPLTLPSELAAALDRLLAAPDEARLAEAIEPIVAECERRRRGGRSR